MSEPLNESVFLLYLTAKEAWSGNLRSANIDEDKWREMDNVSKGDLVVEISSFSQKVNPDNALDYVGYLEKGNSKYGTYTIKRLDGELVRWSNSKFVKVPTYIDLKELTQKRE